MTDKINLKDAGKNPRYGKVIYQFWTNKTESKQIQDGLANDDFDDILLILTKAIKRGDFSKR